VQNTLLLTIALVVGVILLFLRTLWGTVIPAISVPMSLIGTFAVIYVLGYTLDNLSLMALTIAVGFVVDDAIVMIENIDLAFRRQRLPRRTPPVAPHHDRRPEAQMSYCATASAPLRWRSTRRLRQCENPLRGRADGDGVRHGQLGSIMLVIEGSNLTRVG
jgi:hypothetical protein